MADSEYSKRQDGDSTVFEVTRASAPKNITGLVLASVFVIPVGVLAFEASNLSFKLVVAAVAILFGWFGLRDWRPKAHRSNRTFRVSPNGIETNGRTFNKNDIHRLIIKNGVTKDELRSSYAVATNGMAAGMVMAGHAIGQEHKEKIAAVAHSLELETGGKGYILAGGMSETTAYGLMRDVGKIIGF